MKSLFEYYKNVLFPNDDFKNRVAYYTRLVCNKRLPINLTLKGESFTDSRMIYISMNEQEGAENSALSIDFIDTPDVARLYVYGLAVHEAEHVNSSNFEYFEKFIKKVEYALNGTDIELSPYQCNKIGRFIANALEDGRIERRAKVRLPGTKKFLYLLNYNLMYQHECSGSVATDLLNNILCLSKTGVFLKGTVELYESDKEMKDVLLKIRPLIKKAVECDNPIKIYDYAWEIFLICCPIFECCP